jgi:hypothetical protein
MSQSFADEVKVEEPSLAPAPESDYVAPSDCIISEKSASVSNAPSQANSKSKKNSKDKKRKARERKRVRAIQPQRNPGAGSEEQRGRKDEKERIIRDEDKLGYLSTRFNKPLIAYDYFVHQRGNLPIRRAFNRGRSQLEAVKNSCRRNQLQPKTILIIGPGDMKIADQIRDMFPGAVMTYSTEDGAHGERDIGSVLDCDVVEGKFDLIIIFHVLHHLPAGNYYLVIDNLRCLLTPKGFLLIREHDLDESERSMELLGLEHKVQEECGDGCPSGPVRDVKTLMVTKTRYDNFICYEQAPRGMTRSFYLGLVAIPPVPHCSFLRMPIPVHTEDSLAVLQKHGYVGKLVPGENPHELGATARAASCTAALHMLSKAFKPGVLPVVFPYDQGRLADIVRTRGTERFDIKRYERNWNPQDFARGRAADAKDDGAFDELKTCVGGIVCDWYDDCTPHRVYDILSSMAPGAFLYFIVTPLFGRGGTSVGQAYSRDAENITCWTDPEHEPRVHSLAGFPDWLRDGCTMGLGFRLGSVMKRSVLGRHIYQVRIIPPDEVVPEGSRIRSEYGLLTTRMIKVIPKKFHWLPYPHITREEKEVEWLVARKVCDKLALRFSFSQPSAWNIQALISEVTSSLEKDSDWKTFEEFFPEKAAVVASNTVLAGLFLRKQDVVQHAEALNNFYSPYGLRMRNVLAGRNPDRPAWDTLFQRFRAWIVGGELVDGQVLQERRGSYRDTFMRYLRVLGMLFLLWKFRKMIGSVPSRIGGIVFLFHNLKLLFMKYYWRLRGFNLDPHPFQLPQGAVIETMATNPLYVLAEHFLFHGRPVFSVAAHWLFGQNRSFLGAVQSGLVAATLPAPLHLGWNYLVSWLSTRASEITSPWRRFECLYRNGHYTEATDVRGQCAIPVGEMLPGAPAHPTAHLDKIMDPDKSLKIIVNGKQVTDVPDLPGRDISSPMILSPYMLHRPKRNELSLVSAVRQRQLVLVPKPLDPDRLVSIAKKLAAVFELRKPKPGYDHDDLFQWAASYPDSRKRKLAQDLIARVEAGEVPAIVLGYGPGRLVVKIGNKKQVFYHLEMFAKGDESLMLKFARGIWALKPRTIIVYPLMAQLHSQPAIIRASSRLKTHFKETFVINGIRYWFTFASGMNALDLSNWLEVGLELAATCQDVVIAICMGDDSLFYYKGRWYEGDYSHFDGSQSGVFIRLDAIYLESLGVSREIIAMLEALSALPCRYRRRTVYKHIKLLYTVPRAERRSGSPITSLCNTLNNVTAIIFVCESGEITEESFLRAGLKVKLKLHEHIRSATFLKGRWGLGTDGHRHWHSLFGRILKASSVSCPLKSSVEVRQMAYALAMNMGEIHESMPILGPFRKKLVELGTVFEHEIPKSLELDELLDTRKAKKIQFAKFTFGFREHRMRNIMFKPDVADALDFIMHRYGLTPLDVANLENDINNITVLPWFLGSPELERLREDYC